MKRIQFGTNEVIALIREAEHQLAVDEWMADGFHVWPMLRIQLSFQLDSMVAKPLNARSSQHLSAAFNKIAKIPREVLRFYSAKSIDRIHNENLHTKSDCLFYTYSSARRFQVNGGWYDVYFDPLIDKLAERNIRTSVLEYTDHSGYRLPRYRPSKHEHPLRQYYFQAKGILNRSFRVSEEMRNQLDQYGSFLSNHGLGHLFPDAGSLRFRISMIRQYADYFKRIFEKIEPRICFSSNYYGFKEMGMNLACYENGVCSVDIQHGVQGRMHVAYGQWGKVPLSGYELMPRVFWNWSADDKDTIDQWGFKTNGRHVSIVGGNPLLEIFSEETNPLPLYFNKQTETVLNSLSQNVSKHILLTLQPDVGIDSFLKEVLLRSKREWLWWVRLHPNMLHEKKEIIRQLKEIQGLQWNLEQATSLPLYSVLLRMSMHVTMTSSAVLEAGHFNVPSILLHPQAEHMYKEEIQKGIAVYTSKVDEVLHLIPSFSRNTKEPSVHRTNLIQKALDEILRLAK